MPPPVPILTKCVEIFSRFNIQGGFCDRCNRVRLSADGWLRPCLLNETAQLDLKTPWRSHLDPAILKQQVATLLTEKPDINFKERDKGNQAGVYVRTMSQIGG